EPPPEAAKPKAVEPAKPHPEKKKEPVREPAAPVQAFAGHEDVLDIPEPPRAKPAPARAAPKDKSTEDILTDFVLDLEQSEEMADFAPKQRLEQRPAPAPVGAAASAMDRRGFAPKTNGDMQDKESANVLSDILSELQEETAEAAEPEEDP